MNQQPTFSVISVTPQLAKEWLEGLDPQQRRVREHVVRQYARDMIAGAWCLTHQPIAFDAQDRLIDGQHRLHAVVESGQTIDMAVARGVAGDYSLPIDMGLRRTPHDVLHLSNQIIAATITLRRLQHGKIRHQERSSTRASVDEIRETYDKYQRDVDAGCLIITRGMGTAALAGAIAFARPIDPEKVDRFIASVRDGVGLAPNSPALQLRNWLMRHSGKLRDKTDVVMAALSAVRAELGGVSVSVLYTNPSGYESVCAKRRALCIQDTPQTVHEAKAEVSVLDKVLALLLSRGEMSYSDICRETGDRRQAVSDALHRLKKKELVISPSPRYWVLV